MIDAVLILISIGALGIISILIYLLFKLSQTVSQQSQLNLEQAKDIQEIKEKLLLGAQFQDHLKNGIEKTRDLLEELRRQELLRQEKEKEISERVKRMDEIIAGTSAKGMSGEEILRETFKKLPPEMIETNFTVRGKTVEFALVLPNNKKLPIDSKWPAGELILALEKEKSPQKRKEIIQEIERETIKRIKEVKQYIDPEITWSQAIAAVPDSVYSVCKKAHLEASKNHVILIPYSMVLPLLLYMYRLHFQYALSIDMENLQSHLIAISQNLDEMENILENKIYRGATMVSNAYSDYKQMIGKIRSSLQELQIKKPEDSKKLPTKPDDINIDKTK